MRMREAGFEQVSLHAPRFIITINNNNNHYNNNSNNSNNNTNNNNNYNNNHHDCTLFAPQGKYVPSGLKGGNHLICTLLLPVTWPAQVHPGRFQAYLQQTMSCNPCNVSFSAVFCADHILSLALHAFVENEQLAAEVRSLLNSLYPCMQCRHVELTELHDDCLSAENAHSQHSGSHYAAQ